MEICVLASGSNGNALYVESLKTSTAVLIDCGISRRRVVNRLAQKGKSLENVSAIFVTHEHTDHTRGLNVTCKLFDIPLFLTGGTYEGLKDKRHLNRIHLIEKNATIRIGDLIVNAIPKSHDALEPTAYSVSSNGKMFLYATDFGKPDDEIKYLISRANAILLEMNYDDAMLENGPYPYYLRQRIKSSHGHMSNLHSANLIFEYASSHLSHLILGHLSENNNRPEIVRGEIEKVLNQRQDLRPSVHIASRYQASELIRLR